MQRGNKNIQPLKLQSYKLDNEVLASKINELNELKSELESTLSNQKMKESNVVSELQNLKIENQKLRASLSNSQFTKKTQTHLIQQLQNKLQNAQKKLAECLRKIQIVENEKKQLTHRYDAQQEALKQSRAKYRACEQRLIQMSQVVQCNTPRSLEKLMRMEGSLSSIEEKPINIAKKIKKLKKPSIQMESGRASIQLSEKYLSGNVIVQRQEDSQLSGQDVYLEMIRQLFRQLNKIDISPRELFKIPQIEAFARLRNPTNNDLIKLLTVYPFNLKQPSKVELIYQFMEEQAVRKGKTLGGRMIIQQIIGQIEQVQGLRAARSFCETSSLHSQSVNQHIGNQRAKTQPIRIPQQMPSATIDSNIELQSDNSSYF